MARQNPRLLQLDVNQSHAIASKKGMVLDNTTGLWVDQSERGPSDRGRVDTLTMMETIKRPSNFMLEGRRAPTGHRNSTRQKSRPTRDPHNSRNAEWIRSTDGNLTGNSEFNTGAMYYDPETQSWKHRNAEDEEHLDIPSDEYSEATVSRYGHDTYQQHNGQNNHAYSDIEYEANTYPINVQAEAGKRRTDQFDDDQLSTGISPTNSQLYSELSRVISPPGDGPHHGRRYAEDYDSAGNYSEATDIDGDHESYRQYPQQHGYEHEYKNQNYQERQHSQEYQRYDYNEEEHRDGQSIKQEQFGHRWVDNVYLNNGVNESRNGSLHSRQSVGTDHSNRSFVDDGGTMPLANNVYHRGGSRQVMENEREHAGEGEEMSGSDRSFYSYRSNSSKKDGSPRFNLERAGYGPEYVDSEEIRNRYRDVDGRVARYNSHSVGQNYPNSNLQGNGVINEYNRVYTHPASKYQIRHHRNQFTYMNDHMHTTREGKTRGKILYNGHGIRKNLKGNVESSKQLQGIGRVQTLGVKRRASQTTPDSPRAKAPVTLDHDDETTVNNVSFTNSQTSMTASPPRPVSENIIGNRLRQQSERRRAPFNVLETPMELRQARDRDAGFVKSFDSFERDFGSKKGDLRDAFESDEGLGIVQKNLQDEQRTAQYNIYRSSDTASSHTNTNTYNRRDSPGMRNSADDGVGGLSGHEDDECGSVVVRTVRSNPGHLKGKGKSEIAQIANRDFKEIFNSRPLHLESMFQPPTERGTQNVSQSIVEVPATTTSTSANLVPLGGSQNIENGQKKIAFSRSNQHTKFGSRSNHGTGSTHAHHRQTQHSRQNSIDHINVATCHEEPSSFMYVLSDETETDLPLGDMSWSSLRSIPRTEVKVTPGTIQRRRQFGHVNDELNSTLPLSLAKRPHNERNYLSTQVIRRLKYFKSAPVGPTELDQDSNNVLEHAPEHADMLDLSHAELSTLSRLHTPTPFPFLANIHTLSLAKNFLTDIQALGSNLPSLQVLDISYNQLRYLDVETFSTLPKLKWLSADGNDFTPHLSFHAKTRRTGLTFTVPSLQTLSLRSNELQRVDWRGVAFGRSFPHLRALNLDNNSITSVNLKDLRYLRSISLANNVLGRKSDNVGLISTELIVSEGEDECVSLPDSIQYAVLDYNYMRTLDNVLRLPSLRVLKASNNRLSYTEMSEHNSNPITVKSVDRLGDQHPRISVLRVLDISYNHYTTLKFLKAQAQPYGNDKDIQDIHPSRLQSLMQTRHTKFESLSVLLVNNNRLDNRNEVFSALESLPQLSYLDTRFNPFVLTAFLAASHQQRVSHFPSTTDNTNKVSNSLAMVRDEKQSTDLASVVTGYAARALGGGLNLQGIAGNLSTLHKDTQWEIGEEVVDARVAVSSSTAGIDKYMLTLSSDQKRAFLQYRADIRALSPNPNVLQFLDGFIVKAELEDSTLLRLAPSVPSSLKARDIHRTDNENINNVDINVCTKDNVANQTYIAGHYPHINVTDKQALNDSLSGPLPPYLHTTKETDSAYTSLDKLSNEGLNAPTRHTQSRSPITEAKEDKHVEDKFMSLPNLPTTTRTAPTSAITSTTYESGAKSLPSLSQHRDPHGDAPIENMFMSLPTLRKTTPIPTFSKYIHNSLKLHARAGTHPNEGGGTRAYNSAEYGQTGILGTNDDSLPGSGNQGARLPVSAKLEERVNSSTSTRATTPVTMVTKEPNGGAETGRKEKSLSDIQFVTINDDHRKVNSSTSSTTIPSDTGSSPEEYVSRHAYTSRTPYTQDAYTNQIKSDEELLSMMSTDSLREALRRYLGLSRKGDSAPVPRINASTSNGIPEQKYVPMRPTYVGKQNDIQHSTQTQTYTRDDRNVCTRQHLDENVGPQSQPSQRATARTYAHTNAQGVKATNRTDASIFAHANTPVHTHSGSRPTQFDTRLDRLSATNTPTLAHDTPFSHTTFQSSQHTPSTVAGSVMHHSSNIPVSNSAEHDSTNRTHDEILRDELITKSEDELASDGGNRDGYHGKHNGHDRMQERREWGNRQSLPQNNYKYQQERYVEPTRHTHRQQHLPDQRSTRHEESARFSAWNPRKTYHSPPHRRPNTVTSRHASLGDVHDHEHEANEIRDSRKFSKFSTNNKKYYDVHEPRMQPQRYSSTVAVHHVSPDDFNTQLWDNGESRWPEVPHGSGRSATLIKSYMQGKDMANLAARLRMSSLLEVESVMNIDDHMTSEPYARENVSDAEILTTTIDSRYSQRPRAKSNNTVSNDTYSFRKPERYHAQNNDGRVVERHEPHRSGSVGDPRSLQTTTAQANSRRHKASLSSNQNAVSLIESTDSAKLLNMMRSVARSTTSKKSRVVRGGSDEYAVVHQYLREMYRTICLKNVGHEYADEIVDMRLERTYNPDRLESFERLGGGNLNIMSKSNTQVALPNLQVLVYADTPKKLARIAKHGFAVRSSLTSPLVLEPGMSRAVSFSAPGLEKSTNRDKKVRIRNNGNVTRVSAILVLANLGMCCTNYSTDYDAFMQSWETSTVELLQKGYDSVRLKKKRDKDDIDELYFYVLFSHFRLAGTYMSEFTCTWV
eukprot:CFRG0447T1